jgi:hypothetical protein
MAEKELNLLLAVRKYSRYSVAGAIVLSFVFAQFIAESSITWQVAIALIALAIGIPHGALDHLVTLPRSNARTMAIFIAIYVVVAILAVVALLTWNVIGFIFVVVMSAARIQSVSKNIFMPLLPAHFPWLFPWLAIKALQLWKK